MKKFAWLLALAVSFGVVGCGGSEKKPDDKKKDETKKEEPKKEEK